MVGTAHKAVASCSMFVSNWGLEDHWKIFTVAWWSRSVCVSFGKRKAGIGMGLKQLKHFETTKQTILYVVEHSIAVYITRFSYPQAIWGGIMMDQNL